MISPERARILVTTSTVKTSPYYPQSNGKLERWHKSLKSESIRPNCPRDAKEAIQLIGDYVRHYHERRLHSAIG